MRNLFVSLAVGLAALAGGAAAHPSNATDVRLMVYSGWPDPQTFLGCLNCGATDATSIWNPASPYGWANPTGVWSHRADRNTNYRSLVCDPLRDARPPVVLDERWSFYYQLSASVAGNASICDIQMSRQGCAAVRALCEGKPATPPSQVDWSDIAVP